MLESPRRHLRNLLFHALTLCMSYVTNTFLLASSSVRSKQLLCFVQGQGQKTEQKHTTKNFDEFHNHSPLLTMILQTNKYRQSLVVCSSCQSEAVCDLNGHQQHRHEVTITGFRTTRPRSFGELKLYISCC